MIFNIHVVDEEFLSSHIYLKTSFHPFLNDWRAKTNRGDSA